jgi:hypothetical protein
MFQLGFGISVCIQCAAITVMRKMAIATKNEKGQLIDAGLDLNQEGGFGESVCPPSLGDSRSLRYCKDAVILTSIVDCLALFWGKFFLFLLLVIVFSLLISLLFAFAVASLCLLQVMGRHIGPVFLRAFDADG